MKRKLMDVLFDRPPERLDNGFCLDCVFGGHAREDGSWEQWLYQACDWHIRHAGPWGWKGKPRPELKPCKGENVNICVAEGCYGEACVRSLR